MPCHGTKSYVMVHKCVRVALWETVWKRERDRMDRRPNRKNEKENHEFPKFVSMRNCVHTRRMDGPSRWVETRDDDDTQYTYNSNKLEYDEWNAQTRTLTLVNRVVYQVCLCLRLCVFIRMQKIEREIERARMEVVKKHEKSVKRRSEKHPTEPPFLSPIWTMCFRFGWLCWWYAFATFTLQLNALKIFSFFRSNSHSVHRHVLSFCVPLFYGCFVVSFPLHFATAWLLLYICALYFREFSHIFVYNSVSLLLPYTSTHILVALRIRTMCMNYIRNIRHATRVSLYDE